MKFDYILGDSEKDLAPLFSSHMSSITLGGLWVLGIILFLSWPYAPLYQYIKDFRMPWTFFSTFAAALIMVSYMNLRCALGEIIPKIISARMEREEITTHEEERGYLSYGFPQSLIHILVFLLLMLPFLIFGAAVNGISLKTFMTGLGILFTASLLCRQVAFFLLLLWGRWRLSGYLGARLFYCFFLFGTGFIIPDINPVLILFNLHFGERVPIGPVIPASVPYFMVVTSAILVLFLVNHWIIHRKIHKRSPR